MGSSARIMRAARKAQECSTESGYKWDWGCKDFANVRRRGEDKPQSWLQDTGRADGKESRRRAWSSKGKGEAKQTTLGVNPDAPLACSSQSKQTRSPTMVQ